MQTKFEWIPQCFYRVSVKAIIRDKQWKFLLAKENTWLWDFPGWWIDHWEDIFVALKREIKEEMGLTITSIDYRPSCFCIARSSPINNKTPKPRWLIMYEVTVEDLNFTTSDECEGIWFFSIQEALEGNLYIGALDAVNALQKLNKQG